MTSRLPHKGLNSMRFLSPVVILAVLAACGPGPAASTPPAPAATPAPAPTVQPAAAPAADPAAPSPEFANLPEPYKSANYARGKRTFKLCVSCHLIEAGAGNLVGPNLHGVFGRPVGSVVDFDYSNQVKNGGFVWTPEKLDEWLTSPATFLPGNRMSFAGVRKPEDRTAVIAYLMVESGAAPATP